MTYFYNFGTPCISLELVKIEISNLVCWLIARPVNKKNAKVGQEGRYLRHVAYLYNFGTPCISLDWVKLETQYTVLETSKLVCRLTVRPISQKMQNEVKRRVVYVTWPFYNFGTPSISLKSVKLETSNLVCTLSARPTNQKCKSRSKGAWPTSRDLLL